jgi:DNA-binding transcriptional ArsR family regulator
LRNAVEDAIVGARAPPAGAGLDDVDGGAPMRLFARKTTDPPYLRGEGLLRESGWRRSLGYSNQAICLYGYGVDETAETRAAFFHGLSDPNRLSLIEELARGDRRVTDLAALAGLTQPNVSKHLACLWDCGLVERERRGPEIHYRLVPGLTKVLSGADAVLATTGERVRSCPRYGRRAMRQAA